MSFKVVYTIPSSRGKQQSKTFKTKEARDKFIKETPGLKVKSLSSS